MWRPLVPGDRVWVAEFSYFLLDDLDVPLQPGDILLLAEKLFVELADGFVLHGRKGFELDDAFLHDGRIANLQRKGERFRGLLH